MKGKEEFFARFQVDVDFAKELPEQILVRRRKEDNIHEFFVYVEYEECPSFCSKCSTIGHDDKDCRLNEKDDRYWDRNRRNKQQYRQRKEPEAKAAEENREEQRGAEQPSTDREEAVAPQQENQEKDGEERNIDKSVEHSHHLNSERAGATNNSDDMSAAKGCSHGAPASQGTHLSASQGTTSNRIHHAHAARVRHNEVQPSSAPALGGYDYRKGGNEQTFDSANLEMARMEARRTNVPQPGNQGSISVNQIRPGTSYELVREASRAEQRAFADNGNLPLYSDRTVQLEAIQSSTGFTSSSGPDFLDEQEDNNLCWADLVDNDELNEDEEEISHSTTQDKVDNYRTLDVSCLNMDKIYWNEEEEFYFHKSGMCYDPVMKAYFSYIDPGNEDWRCLYYVKPHGEFKLAEKGELGESNRNVRRDRSWDKNCVYSTNATYYKPGLVKMFLDTIKKHKSIEAS